MLLLHFLNNQGDWRETTGYGRIRVIGWDGCLIWIVPCCWGKPVCILGKLSLIRVDLRFMRHHAMKHGKKRLVLVSFFKPFLLHIILSRVPAVTNPLPYPLGA